MKKAKRGTKSAGIGDQAVKRRTGKGWKEWFAVLDRAGSTKMSHLDIARYLYRQQGLSGWWAQMVTVGYEQARGLRQKHQRPSGYSINRGKTINAAIADVFEAWADPKTRRRWLKDWKVLVRRSTPNKSMRITWADGKSSLDVNFYSKGKKKSVVNVEHSKLADAREAGRMKAYWGERLDRLAAFVQG